MKNIATFDDFTNESFKNKVSKANAAAFITQVLKLGSKDNLFDAFMKKEGIDPNDVGEFVKLVADEIQDKWTT